MALIASVGLWLAVGAADAGAHRRASAHESRSMWRAVDRSGTCVQRRGRISTVATPGYRYGTVTIADSHCGNGSFVLRRRAGTGGWQIRLAGSDIGAPERCADDRRRVPIRVLRDLLYRDLCR
ncbi:MAG: hypothetical protein JWQ48_1541 [Conexibacter sp.]|nr:hypothetical protein [Conexibacter sp.]